MMRIGICVRMRMCDWEEGKGVGLLLIDNRCATNASIDYISKFILSINE